LSGTEFSIAKREIHIWIVRLIATDDHVSALFHLCSSDEKARAQAFRFEHHRRLFIIGRGLLRAILGRYLGQTPEQVCFRYGTKGKPALERSGLPPLYFNLSHSDNCVIYAVTHENELGVDVERVRQIAEAESTASHFFSPEECKDLCSVDASHRVEAFLNCWTRKEAYLKAVGDGLCAPLDRFQVSLKPEYPAAFLNFAGGMQDASRWSLHHLTPAEGYIGALAIPAVSCCLVQRTFLNAVECLNALQRCDRQS